MLATSLGPGAVPEQWGWQKSGLPNFGEFGVRGQGRKFGPPKGGGLGFPRGTLLFWRRARTGEIRPVAGGREGRLPCTARARLKSGGAARGGRNARGRAGSEPYSLRDRRVRAERGLRGSGPGPARPEGTRSQGWALRACGCCPLRGCGRGGPRAPRGRAGAGSGPRGRAREGGGDGGEGCDALTGGIPRRGGGGRGRRRRRKSSGGGSLSWSRMSRAS